MRRAAGCSMLPKSVVSGRSLACSGNGSSVPLSGRRVVSGRTVRMIARRIPSSLWAPTRTGSPLRFTCDPNDLANYFGANPEAPHYLTPVYFRREVLQRYYADSAKYQVQDGVIRCGDLWLLRIDNHLPNVVAAYLGDLGRDLPASERGHWLPFNIEADAGISRAKELRDFRAVPTAPEAPDLLFKYRFEQFHRAWHERFGWPLFLPLHAGDAHLFIGLREPLTEDQGEFDSQVLALTKLLIDSLNEAQIGAALGSVPAGTKGVRQARHVP